MRRPETPASNSREGAPCVEALTLSMITSIVPPAEGAKVHPMSKVGAGERAEGERFGPDRDQIICVCIFGYKSKYIPLFVRVFSAQFKRRLPLWGRRAPSFRNARHR